MKEKIIRSIIFFGSFFLLSATVWMVSWVNQNEVMRLAVLKRLHLEEERELQFAPSPAGLVSSQGITGEDQVFSDIEALLLSIGADDVPTAE